MDWRHFLKKPLFRVIYRDVWRCLIICIVLEIVVLPFWCSSWHDSRYFKFSEDFVNDVIEAEYLSRQSAAEHYFERVVPESSLSFHTRNNREELLVLVLVLTVKRNYTDYLLQTVAALDREIKQFHADHHQVCDPVLWGSFSDARILTSLKGNFESFA